MNRLIIILVLVFSFLSSCENGAGPKIGFTFSGLPITLSVNSSGIVGLQIGTRWVTPLGVLTIGEAFPDIFWSSHKTILVIKETSENIQYYYELERGEAFDYVDNHRTHIEVRNQPNNTVVIIESEEIENFLKVSRLNNTLTRENYTSERSNSTTTVSNSSKPQFPASPLPYFYFVNKINVDWSIHSVADVVSDVFFVFLYIIVGIIDLCIMGFILALRIAWFLLLLLFYLLSSMF